MPDMKTIGDDLVAALDLQYSMIILPKEEKIRVSALGFGVVSINGLFSLNLLSLLEPYAGLTLNYIYLNSEEEFIGVVKAIPKLVPLTLQTW